MRDYEFIFKTTLTIDDIFIDPDTLEVSLPDYVVDGIIMDELHEAWIDMGDDEYGPAAKEVYRRIYTPYSRNKPDISSHKKKILLSFE